MTASQNASKMEAKTTISFKITFITSIMGFIQNVLQIWNNCIYLQYDNWTGFELMCK